MRRLAASVVLFASLLVATVALADAPSTMSYQGVLTDNNGVFVADGNYNLTFRLYDVSVGGVALHTENFPAVAVERGGFSVILGSISALPAIFDRQIHLGVQVGADPEMTPRVALASSPSAMALRLPLFQTQTNASALLELRNTGGVTARLHGLSQIGSSAQSGQLDIVRAGSTASIGNWYTSAFGAHIDLNDDEDNAALFMGADASGTGGTLSIRRTTGLTGFLVDGNRIGTNEPAVLITGSVRSANFDMSLPGNTSVALPTDAISSTEMFDESGVASINKSITTALGGTVETLLQRSITVPADGYCLVMGTVEAQAFHTNLANTQALFGVSDQVGVLPPTQDFNFLMPANAPTGTYIVPVTVHGMFTVTAGPNTFYLLGDETNGDVRYAEVALSIIYVPTAYGTVTATAPAGGVDGLSAAAPRFGASERSEAEAFHRARVEREMTAMRVQVEELKRQLDRVDSEQASVAPRKEK